MKRSKWWGVIVAVTATALAACRPADRSSTSTNPAPPVDQPSPTLRAILRTEPVSLTESLGRNYLVVAMFGSPLVGFSHELRYPILSSAPQLGTDTWQVLPDGRMETTFRLKPGLTWHDGGLLSAEDMVLARQVDSGRVQYGLRVSQTTTETNAIEDVLAPNPETVVIRWKRPFADAAHPTLAPLPRHILGTVLEQGGTDSSRMGDHHYWTDQYIGLGPYRLARWEPGAFIEATAFEGYALGRPKIDRVVLTWNGDPNVLATRLLSGDADYAPDLTLGFQQGVMLRREWGGMGSGVVVFTPSDTRFLGAQLRPAYASPRAILDLRVRKASIHAIDRMALADALYEGQGIVAESNALPGESFFAALNQIVTTYPFDLGRTEGLMREAGFAKGSDGVYASSEQGKFAPEVAGLGEGAEAEETTAIADYFHRAGFDAQLRLISNAQLGTDLSLRATYPSWRTNYGALPTKFFGPDIATKENGWGGGNKIGWLNPENDRLVDLWRTSLDEAERSQLLLQAYKNMNDDLPILPLHYDFRVTAHVTGLDGPQGTLPDSAETHFRNLHEWHWNN